MKRILFVFYLILNTLLFGFEITVNNLVPEISEDRGFAKVSSENSLFSQNVGEPAIPIRSVFFEIPSDKKIKDVNFEGRN